MSVKAWESRDYTAAFALHRVRGDRPFTDRHLRRAAILAPHLTRAVRMSDRLAETRQAEALTGEALECLSGAAFVVDAEARISASNRAASALLRQGDGLLYGPHGLRAARPATTAELRRLIAAAAAPDGLAELDRSAALLLERPSGRRPFSSLIGPFRAGDGWDLWRGVRAAAIVLVSDPEVIATPSAERLRRLYGLTPAEAALAIAVTRGEGLGAVARGLGISLTTARTHLQRVFGKTGTNRQAELVRLLLTMSGGDRTQPL